METFWQVFLGTLGAGGILVGVLAFIGKGLFNQLLAKDLERFKADLKAEATANQVVFSRLHDERAKVIASIYALASELDQQLAVVGFLVDVDPDEADIDVDKIANIYNELESTYRTKRIWLSPTLAQQLNDFSREASTAVGGTLAYSNTKERKHLERMSKNLTPLIQALESEFRKVLGTS